MNATETVAIKVCHDCAVIVANGDDSMPGGEVKSEAIEALGGWIVVGEDADDDGYFDCFTCGQIEVATTSSPAHLAQWETRA